MEKAENRQSRVGTVGPENPYRIPLRAVPLAIVGGDHAHIMAAARQGTSEECLLNRFAADGVPSVFRGQGR